ncbi:AAA domain-containing protein [Halenospora varia]|nr:AAA domain-containing protein [Halenospora varia]
MTTPLKPRDIYIVGAQSTGKTTLVKAVENHFKGANRYPITRPKIITEVARTVLEQLNFTASDIKSSPARALALQQRILQAQLSAEHAVSEQGDWFVSDRSGVDPIVYTRKYVSKDAANDLVKSTEWLELRDRMKKSVVIVCEAGVDWLTDDGVRLMPESREDWIGFHQLFCSYLEDWDLGYEVLRCDVTGMHERVAFVLERWELTLQSGVLKELEGT